MRLPDFGLTMRDQGLTSRTRLFVTGFYPSAMADHGKFREVAGIVDMNDDGEFNLSRRLVATLETKQTVQDIARLARKGGPPMIQGSLGDSEATGDNGAVFLPIVGRLRREPTIPNRG
jgi:hypothetical protein